ncbi:MAG: SPOR domain-containing protein [Clostridia bacterium]|nr:SPOR domain-containing protein [Clostridia bacterium]
MNLHTVLATNNECYIVNHGTPWTPTGIMVHSTGANNPFLKRYVGPDDGLLGQNQYGNTWNQYRPAGKRICCHAFIGKLKDGSIATYQILPWDCKGWNNGGSSNDTHLAFEICEDGLSDKTYFDKVYREAVELCAFLCKKFNIDVRNVIDHAEGYKKGIASNHGDVAHWFPKHGKSMDAFRADVAAQIKANEAAETGNADTPGKAVYRVQVGAYTVKANAEALQKKLKAAGFESIIKVDGDVDGDGKVTAADARQVLRQAVGLE